jgi:perosamine synthetase
MYAVLLNDSAPFDAIEFARRLQDMGVQTRPFFLGMHEQPVYHGLGLFNNLSLPATECIARRGLYLPSGQAITDAQIHEVIEAINQILQGS